MPLRGKNMKATVFSRGLTTTQINYSDIDTSDIDTDLSSVSSSDDT